MLSWARIRHSAVLATAVSVIAAVGIGGASAAPTDQQPPIETCPALFALGIQGTGQSSPDAAVTTDTGMLSTVFRPMLAAAPDEGLVARAYVPYDSSFGGATSANETPYATSVSGGLGTLKSMARSVLDRCEHTRIAVTGYSQGAHVASLFAQEVGAGKGAIPADRVAAVALFGDPTRNPGAPLFPGSPGKVTPDAVPGTGGDALSRITAQPAQVAYGGGIGPERDVAANFGALTGRVASFCASGDLACDVPEDAALLKVVANIAGQVKLSGGDPIGSLMSIGQALAFTSVKTVTNVVNDDVSGTSLSNLRISPQKSISQRLAEASDPRNPVNVPDAFQALLKLGTIAINTVVTVVRSVLTPGNIAEIATAGLANPLAGLAVLGAKVVGAVTQLVPPTTIDNLVTEAFEAVVENLQDNKDLFDANTWVRYWQTAQKHDYSNPQGSDFGDSPAQFVGQWFAALAHDLAGVHDYGGAPEGGSDRPDGGFDFAPSTTSTPSTAPGGQFPLGEPGDATTAPNTSPSPLFAPTAPTTNPAGSGGFPLASPAQPQVIP
ncbi:cutinase family protein [Nocardia sp. CC227C]|uniref:cutinase family protein n=1 Tax=Nocardia sp. CC227C TaxID=3044562 RepID=UPI00278C4EA0|nr:cutinase family protein [Nocardia sp. CC227C]